MLAFPYTSMYFPSQTADQCPDRYGMVTCTMVTVTAAELSPCLCPASLGLPDQETSCYWSDGVMHTDHRHTLWSDWLTRDNAMVISNTASAIPWRERPITTSMVIQTDQNFLGDIIQTITTTTLLCYDTDRRRTRW